MTRCHSLILGYAYKCVVSQQDDNNGRYGGNVSRGVSDLAVRVADDEASFGFFGHPRWREIGLTPETAAGSPCSARRGADARARGRPIQP